MRGNQDSVIVFAQFCSYFFWYNTRHLWFRNKVVALSFYGHTVVVIVNVIEHIFNDLSHHKGTIKSSTHKKRHIKKADIQKKRSHTCIYLYQTSIFHMHTHPLYKVVLSLYTHACLKSRNFNFTFSHGWRNLNFLDAEALMTQGYTHIWIVGHLSFVYHTKELILENRVS